jgi:spore coat polysaccharide biosynthesis protein SpsF
MVLTKKINLVQRLNMKCSIIIQARCSSTRLPNKVLKKLHNKSVLTHIIERIRCCENIENIIVATTDKKVDDLIVAECINVDIPCFRGSDDNVLARYYYAAKQYQAERIIRLTADNLFTDIESINALIREFSNADYDYMKTHHFLPLGTGGELMTFQALEKAFIEAREHVEREHVTPYIYQHPSLFHIGEQKYCSLKNDCSKIRLTLDTPEDWDLCSRIFDALYCGKPLVFQDLIDYLNNHPNLLAINANVIQVTVS